MPVHIELPAMDVLSLYSPLRFHMIFFIDPSKTNISENELKLKIHGIWVRVKAKLYAGYGKAISRLFFRPVIHRQFIAKAFPGQIAGYLNAQGVG